MNELCKAFSEFLGPIDEFDQIGVNYYTHSGEDGDTDPSFTGIVSHEEGKKFGALKQINIAKSSMMTYDGGNGNVNATVGFEMPSGSIIHHLMDSYFQKGWRRSPKAIQQGGKHAIARRHLIMRPGQWRLAIMLRICTKEANAEVLKHFKNCKNNDFYCQCINPHLRRN